MGRGRGWLRALPGARQRGGEFAAGVPADERHGCRHQAGRDDGQADERGQGMPGILGEAFTQPLHVSRISRWGASHAIACRWQCSRGSRVTPSHLVRRRLVAVRACRPGFGARRRVRGQSSRWRGRPCGCLLPAGVGARVIPQGVWPCARFRGGRLPGGRACLGGPAGGAGDGVSPPAAAVSACCFAGGGYPDRRGGGSGPAAGRRASG